VPANVTAKRNDDDEGARIEAQHDGYRADYGLIHRRAVYMDKAGVDLRGVDTLSRPANEKKAPDDFRPPFAIRFHLHPDVVPTMGEAGVVYLEGPFGSRWRFRTDAANLALEDSVYLGNLDGPARTRQVVLSGEADPKGVGEGPPNRVRWAFTRLDRA
jgi:uncharacterized heparinase superfamily protein